VAIWPPFLFDFNELRGTRKALAHSLGAMTKFRFITPHRSGKWYSDLHLAQRFAHTIGAGFLDPRSGHFVAYPGTQLETAAPETQLER